jgi:hypothetical protein
VFIPRHWKKAATCDGAEREEGEAKVSANDWPVWRVCVRILERHWVSSLLAHPTVTINDHLKLVNVVKVRIDPSAWIQPIHQKRLWMWINQTWAADIVYPTANATIRTLGLDFSRLMARNSMHNALPC